MEKAGTVKSPLRRIWKPKWAPYAWAFFIPLQIGLLMFALKNITPFGDQSMLCMDLWGQYVPMYVQQNTGGADGLFYSWNGAFGYNVWAQNAYYGNMLSFLVLRLFPLADYPAVIGYISLLKLSLSAVACLYFLRHHFAKGSPILVGGAVSYSVCAYMLAFFSQCMWTDTLIYAPLVLFGVDRLIREKKTGAYILWLGLAIFSNFYVGFALCLFTAAYFLVESAATMRLKRTASGRWYLDDGVEWLKLVGRFAMASLLAGGLSAFVTLPTLAAIGNAQAAGQSSPAVVSFKDWHANIFTVLRSFVPGGELRLAYADKGANLATGIGVFLLVPLYFCNRSVRKTERILNGLLLVFLTLSVNNKALDFIWHGFHFPNQLPGRWTFLLSLFVVLLGCRALMRTEGLSLPRVLIGGNIGYVLLLVSVFSDKTENPVTLSAEQHGLFWLMWLGVVAVTAFPYLWKRGHSAPVVRRGIAVCLAAVTLCQVISSGLGFWSSATSEREGLNTSLLATYKDGMVYTEAAGQAVKALDDGWYRAEANNGFTFNPSMIGDYHGMGCYSSTMNHSTYNLLQTMGNRVYALNISTIYNLSSVVQNSLFGVKYYVGSGMEQTVPNSELVTSANLCSVWKNPTALSVAFAVPGDPTAFEATANGRSIDNQAALLNALYGTETGVYRQLTCTDCQHEGITLYENSGWDSNNYQTDTVSGNKYFRYTFVCEGSGPVYIEQNFYTGTMSVSGANGKNAVTFAPELERFKYVGNYDEGDEITVTMPLEAASGHYGVNLYRMDTEKWQEVYETFAAQQMTVEDFSGTALSGTLTLSADSYVFTSLSQDGGWTMLCDGKPVETATTADCLLTARLPAGTHQIEFRYSVPKLKIGGVISAVSLLLAVWFACPALRRRMLHRSKPVTETPAKTETAEAETEPTE